MTDEDTPETLPETPPEVDPVEPMTTGELMALLAAEEERHPELDAWNLMNQLAMDVSDENRALLPSPGEMVDMVYELAKEAT